MKRIIATLLSLALVLTTMVMPAVAETADADIIVVGAGGAGLSAALAAAEAGAEKVIVLEMTAKTGGALNFTSGSMSAAGTIIQKEEGIEDTVESYIADINNELTRKRAEFDLPTTDTIKKMEEHLDKAGKLDAIKKED